MRVAYLGRLSSFHAQNTLLTFMEAGYQVLALNTNRGLAAGYDAGIGLPSVNAFVEAPAGPAARRRARVAFLSHLLGSAWPPADLGPDARAALERFRPDLIYAAWGSNDLPEILALKAEFPCLPVVHSVQCFPIAVPTVGPPAGPTVSVRDAGQWVRLQSRRARELLILYAERRLYGHTIKKLNGRIDPSRTMQDYLAKLYGPPEVDHLLWMERYSQRYFYRARLPLLSDRDGEPHVVFLGRTDFSHDAVDDIRSTLVACARAGIHVHLAAGDEIVPASPYIHRFPARNAQTLIDGSLATFCTQFDACGVWYNVAGPSARLNNTLPSRFLFAIPAGIPIVLPAGLFASCEEVTAELGIGFTYRGVTELAERLRDRRFMQTLRARALEAMPQETFENRFSILDSFLRRVPAATACT